MNIEIHSVMLVLLTIVTVKAITQLVKTESSKTVEKENTITKWIVNNMIEKGDLKSNETEVTTVSSASNSTVEYIKANFTVNVTLPEKPPNPVVVAYFVANLGDKIKKTEYSASTELNPRNMGSTKYGYANGILTSIGVDGRSLQSRMYTPYTTYTGYHRGYRYGYGAYGYTIGSGYPVLGKLGVFERKLRRIRDQIHFWRGLVKSIV